MYNQMVYMAVQRTCSTCCIFNWSLENTVIGSVETQHGHAGAEGYVIGVDVCMYICIIYVCTYVLIYVCDPKKFEWHFSGQFTFSNTRSRLLVKSLQK